MTESAESAEEPAVDALAERFFDEKIGPHLRDNLGQPETLIAVQRQQFIDMVLGARFELRDYARGPYVTKSGKELSDADIEELSDEAERGYDVSDRLAPLTWEFDCVKRFEITAGELNVQAESNLTRQGVLRTIEPGTYRFVIRVTAPTIGDAGIAARERLDAVLAPYGIEILVTDTSTKRLRKSEKPG